MTGGLLDVFGAQRVLDTPLAESSIVGVAIGMAANGCLPVAELQFADFAFPAVNQLISEAAKWRYRTNGASGCRSWCASRKGRASGALCTIRSRSRRCWRTSPG